MPPSTTIDEVCPDAAGTLDEFFAYLREHVAENGAPGTGYFQPQPRHAPGVSAEREAGFRAALLVPVAEPGWRRLWIARRADGRIAGHIDLRAHAQPYAGHRCLLGMGVHRGSRRGGVGSQLLEHALHWAHAMAGLEWVDLQVLSANDAAKALYRRCGFATVGEIEEMFRIDGQCFGYTYMARRLARQGMARKGVQG